MEVRVLGPLQVLNDGLDVTPGGRLQRTVFLRLVLDANRTVSVDRLVEDVFEDEAQLRDPSAFVQVHVSRLRKTLAGSGDGAAELIVSKRPGYCLHLGHADVDSWCFERLASEGKVALEEGRPEVAAANLEHALALWRGPPLADVAFVAFARGEITRLEELRLAALESLYEAKLAIGTPPEVVAELQAMVSEHPLRERLWGLLMRALYLEGRQTEALRAYQQLRIMLDEEVGLAPSAELQELELAMLRQDPTIGSRPPMPVEGSGPTWSPQRPGSLPQPLTRFVGRREGRTELATRLANTRLVTLKGMAGIGKTRLALEVCTEAQASMPGGVWLVELAPLTDLDLVLPAVATALGVREEPGLAPGEALARAIGEQALLVVLDNCEHLLQACAELAWNLLQRCPNVRIMATSQEVLGVPGEGVWPVPPLSMPPVGAQVSPSEMAGHDAVQLFCDRATLVLPDFSLQEGNCAAVATICRRLDGLPLAIELAAAAVAQLSVKEIAELLDDRFNLLTGGSRWVPGRHQTLLGAVEWSYELLSDAERVLLRRLSVFAGGATVGAIEEVCAGEALAVSDVFAVLGRLVAKSLAVADTAGHQARYRLLETIRHYAADRLFEAGEHRLVAERHARWCVGLAERAEPELSGPEQFAWHDRLASDIGNIRAALAWAVAEQHEALALRLSGAMTLFWSRRGHWQEGREWLEASLAIGETGPEPVRAKAWWGAARMRLDLNDDQAAARAAVESLALWRSCGNRRGEARALLVIGRSGESHGRLTALQALEESARVAREVGDLVCLSESLVSSGFAQLHRGELPGARSFLEEAVKRGEACRR